MGEHIYARDLELPKGTTLVVEADTLIAAISAPTVAEEAEGTEGAAAEAAAPAESAE